MTDPKIRDRLDALEDAVAAVLASHPAHGEDVRAVLLLTTSSGVLGGRKDYRLSAAEVAADLRLHLRRLEGDPR